MTNVMTLCANETQSIAAAKGRDGRPGKTADGSGKVSQSFRKKLEAYGAMAVPAQQTAADGGKINPDTGMQDATETVQVLSEAVRTIEGIELPANPQGIAEMPAAAGDSTAPAPDDGAAQGMFVEDGRDGGAVAGQNARMQTAIAGESPAITQDQILKTVGEYLDEAIGSEGQKAEVPVLPEEAPEAVGPPLGEQADETAKDAPKITAADGLEQAQDGKLSPKEGSPAPKSQGPAESREAVSKGTKDAKPAGAAGFAPEKAERAEDTAEFQNANAMADVRAAAPAQEEIAAPAALETDAAEEPQYDRENILRIVDSVSTKSAEGRHEFEIGLKPEFLGKVRIKLTMEHGSIHMQIHTDDPDVKQMLSDHSSSLMNELREKGVALLGMDVSYESPASFAGAEQQSGRNGGGRQGGAAHFFAQAEPQAEQSRDVFSLYAGNSTVEFYA